MQYPLSAFEFEQSIGRHAPKLAAWAFERAPKGRRRSGEAFNFEAIKLCKKWLRKMSG
jgi:hypothetical protein